MATTATFKGNVTSPSKGSILIVKYSVGSKHSSSIICIGIDFVVLPPDVKFTILLDDM